MRATSHGRDRLVGRATGWGLAALTLCAAGMALLLAWEILVDPLAVAQMIESLVGRH